jgi:hypothetical protein
MTNILKCLQEVAIKAMPLKTLLEYQRAKKVDTSKD